MTDSSRLFGAQKEALRDALMSAFYNRDELDQLLTFRLNRSLDEVAGPGNLKAVTLAVIKAAEGEGWTDALIRKAHEYRPNNPSLQGFFAAYVGSTQRDVDRALGDSGAELERTIEALNAFQDVRAWRERLCEIEARVCRIDHGGPDKPQGTGFLVAPDVVMTNHHVLAKLIAGAWRVGDVILRFDHHRLVDGSTTRGTEHRLHADWCIASSPPSALDTRPDATAAPSTAELDFALVRLAAPAGADRVEGRERGAVTFRRGAVAFKPGMGLIIVQHPRGGPMKLAIDTKAVTEVTANQTRVRYRTNTEPGSSGSPCFTMGWELAALHHSGNPELQARYNEGVPLDTICDQLPTSARAAVGW